MDFRRSTSPTSTPSTGRTFDIGPLQQEQGLRQHEKAESVVFSIPSSQDRSGSSATGTRTGSRPSLLSLAYKHVFRIAFLLMLLHEMQENRLMTFSGETRTSSTETSKPPNKPSQNLYNSRTNLTKLVSKLSSTLPSADTGMSPTTPSVAASEVPVTDTTTLDRELANLTFFYNIYIDPKRPRLQRHALLVIEEQINQIGRSHVTKFRPGSGETHFPFFYSTIGKPVDREWIKELAAKNGLRAMHGRHVPTGNEETTLQPLHDFCRANPEQAVIYVHPKGTFHRGNYDAAVKGNWIQDDLRKLLTHAVTHEVCLRAVLAPDPDEDGTRTTSSPNNSATCQLCGLLFQPLPSFHIPGNMWIAKCSYIQHLASPEAFPARVAEVVKTLHTVVQASGLLQNNYFPVKRNNFVSPSTFGLGRYSLEHWVASSPLLVKPCHISPLPGFDDLTINRDTMIPDWEVKLVGNGSPSFPLDHPDWHFHHHVTLEQRQEVMSNEAKRRTEFFFLPGFLYKWKSLYHMSPPLDSWVWNWFPDGEYWKSQLETHPLFTTQWLAAPETQPQPQSPQATPQDPQSEADAEDAEQQGIRLAFEQNNYDMLLYNWAIENLVPTTTSIAHITTNITRSRPPRNPQQPPTCLVVIQIPKATPTFVGRKIRRLATERGWGFLNTGTRTTIRDFDGIDFASGKITSGLLTPHFFEAMPSAHDCLRMTVLRHPLDRVLDLFHYSKQHDFEACFGREVNLTDSSSCAPEAVNYQNDMVRMLGGTNTAVTRWDLARYHESLTVGPAELERAQRELADMDLVCFMEQIRDCIPQLRKMVGLSGR